MYPSGGIDKAAGRVHKIEIVRFRGTILPALDRISDKTPFDYVYPLPRKSVLEPGIRDTETPDFPLTHVPSSTLPIFPSFPLILRRF